MRKTVGITAGLVAAVVAGFVGLSCGDSTSPGFKRYVANLSPANEVPINTAAGTGVVTFVDQGTQIVWTMELANVTNMTVSHIHAPAATGVNTGVMINLFFPNQPPPTGTLNGIVAEGTITSANNSAISLDSLRTLFNNGNAYVNVHTSAFPGGQLRDQIRPVN